MTIWYYTVGQEREGPVSKEQVRALIASGKIVRDAYVWREGMADWEIVGTHPEFADTFVAPLSVKPPPLPFASKVLDGEQNAMRPWRRFWARLVDIMLLGPLLAAAIAFTLAAWAPSVYIYISAMERPMLDVLLMVALLPIIAVALALCMTLFDTTPGKALAGVQGRVPHGTNRLFFYLTREFRVWFSGLGMGIPVFLPIALVVQYRRLVSCRAASYDTASQPIAVNARRSLIPAIALAVVLFAGHVFLWKEGDLAATYVIGKQVWVNPINGKETLLPSFWNFQPLNSSSETEIQFATDDLLALDASARARGTKHADDLNADVGSRLVLSALFGHDTLGWDGITPEKYASIIDGMAGKLWTRSSDWRPVEVEGFKALRATGYSRDPSRVDVETTLIVQGRDAWQVSVSTYDNSPDQLRERDRFLSALLQTIK